MKCKDCVYWKNIESRIYASISGITGSITRGIIELRPCEFRPSPNISDVFYRFTDGNNTCSNGKREE